MTRFCTSCGQPIEGDTKFCTNCGAPVPPVVPPVEPQPQPQPQQPYYEPQPQQPYYESQPQQPYYEPEPQPEIQQPVGDKPGNLLPLSIVTTIICCWPLGIPAILNAAKVDKLWNNGQYDEARSASKRARTFIILSAVLGFVACIVYAIAILAEDL